MTADNTAGYGSPAVIDRRYRTSIHKYERFVGKIRSFSDRFPGTVDAVSCTMKKRTDVALILWNEDVIELVSLVLLGRDLICHGLEPSEGPDRIENLIASGSPRVVVFDLHPPYARSSEVALRLMNRFPNMSFVITCADRTLALKSAPWLSRHRVFQKPYDIDEVAGTVSLMVRSDRIRFAGLPVTPPRKTTISCGGFCGL